MKYDFKINKLAKDVYEIENFLNEDELARMINIINYAKPEQWFDKENIKDESDFWYDKSLFLHYEQEFCQKAVFDKVDYIFPSYFYCEKQLKISRYRQGELIREHRDNDTTPAGYYLGYGLVIYYNDNYLGGELDYPELGFKVKPKPGSALLHGGEVMHGSLPVTSDSLRYFSTIFMRGNDEYPIILNKDIPF
jgi:hypothetical protein